MAITAPVRTRRAPARKPTAPAPARRDGLRLVESGGRRSTRGVRRPAALVACTLVVGSLLATVAAHAYLTQGQIRLARLQQQVAVQIAAHRDLELQVSQLENPAHVVVQAQHQGLSAPSQVGDLPQVSLGTPLPAATPTPSTTTAPKTTTTAPKTTTDTAATAAPTAHTTPTTTTVPSGHAGGSR